MVREVWSTRRGAAVPAAPDGADRTVLLIPGFLAPNMSLRPLSSWLRAAGWRTHRAAVGLNTGCSQRVLDVLVRRAEQVHALEGERLLVIGQSRGGVHARALAAARPDLVHASVALGSPVRDVLDVRPSVRKQLEVLARLGSQGVPGLLTRECETGPCCADYRSALTGAPPEGVRLYAIYSPSDEIVSPEACRDPHADCRSIDCGHQAMSLNAAVWRELAVILSGLDVA